MAETKLEFGGDTAVAQREVDKLTKQVAKLREELRKTNDETRKAKPDGGFGGWTQGLAKLKDQMDPFQKGMRTLTAQQEAYRNGLMPVVTLQDKFRGHLIHSQVAARNLGTSMQTALGSSLSGYAALATVMAGVTAEMKGQVDAARELAGFQKGAAGSQRAFLRNLGVVPQSERTAALQKIGQISSQTGVPETQLYGAAVQATAAKGGLSNLQALDAVRVAAMVAPDDQTELAATTGGLLDTASLTGSSNAMENLGVVAALGEQTRVGSLKDISENLVPAAIGVKGFGGSAGDAAALVTAMTQGTKDTTGRMSGTASISLAKQLAEFLPEKDTYSWDSKGKKKLDAKGTGLTDTASRIAKLQGDAALREQFMAQASFEAKAIIPSRELLTGGTALAEQFERNRGAYVTGDAAAAQGQRFIEGLNTTGLQENAAQGRTAAQIAEDLRLQRIQAGKQGNAYEAYSDVTGAAGYGTFSRGIGAAEIFARSLFTGSANTAAADTLQGTLDTTPLAKNNPEVAAAFRDMIAHLRSIDQKTNAAARNIDAHTE